MSEDRSRTQLRIAVSVALLVAAGLAILVQPRVVEAVRAGELSAGFVLVGPAAFSLVVVLAALETWRTARRRGFFPGRRVLGLAFAAAFMGVLLPDTVTEYRARIAPPSNALATSEKLLSHNDPRVRALVLEAAAGRPGPDAEVAPLFLRGLDDADPLVTDAALRGVWRRQALRDGHAAGPDGDNDKAAHGVERAAALASARQAVRLWLDADGHE